MRGIFFSLDAILAMLVAFLMSAAILQAIAGIPSTTDPSLQLLKISEDSLAIMEKNGALKDSVTSSTSLPIKQFAQILPNNLCYRISISMPPAANSIIAEENCKCKSFTVARRSFLLAGDSVTEYLAEMRACYK